MSRVQIPIYLRIFLSPSICLHLCVPSSSGNQSILFVWGISFSSTCGIISPIKLQLELWIQPIWANLTVLNKMTKSVKPLKFYIHEISVAVHAYIYWKVVFFPPCFLFLLNLFYFIFFDKKIYRGLRYDDVSGLFEVKLQMGQTFFWSKQMGQTWDTLGIF